MTRLNLSQLITLVCVSCSLRICVAQESTTQPAIRFVEGRQIYNGIRFPQLPQDRVNIVEFEIRPPPPAHVQNWQVTFLALRQVFAPNEPVPTTRDAALELHNRLIAPRRFDIGRTPTTCVWTIAATDEGTAKRLAEAVVQTYREAIAFWEHEPRERADERSATIAKLKEEAAQVEAEVQKTETALQTAGVLGTSPESIDAIAVRLDSERRLNEVEIRGIERSLEEARKRYAERATAPPGEGADQAQLRLEVLRTLARLQVEFEIQLVGKLAQRDSLASSAAEMSQAREAMRSLRAAAERREQILKRLSTLESHQEDTLKYLAEYEAARNAVLVDNTVTLCTHAR